VRWAPADSRGGVSRRRRRSFTLWSLTTPKLRYWVSGLWATLAYATVPNAARAYNAIGMAVKSNFLACENNPGQDEFTKTKHNKSGAFNLVGSCRAQRLSLGAG